jgi:chromosomal replication initiator protein
LPEDIELIWKQVRAALREEVSDLTYHLWLAPLSPAAWRDDLLFIRAPDHLRTWVEERYAPVLADAARQVLGRGGVLIVPESWQGPDADSRPAPDPEDELNPKYTFDQFVIGPSNRLAHAAALAVAELPSHAYNPLFIHGEPGVGKTHLLHAIGHYLRAHGDGATVRYAPVETFTRLFVRAARGGEVEAFKLRFRDVNVLLVDDVQFMATKTVTKEEFFHTFNQLFEGGSQLVITNDRAPLEMGEFETRLVERFASGLVARLDPPEFATRLAILRKRALVDALVDVSDEALREVARVSPSSVRALEGALIRLVAHCSLAGRDATVEAVRDILGTPPEPSVEPCTVDRIQRVTAEAFGVSVEALLRKDRRATVARARQVAMFLARELTRQSFPELGRCFAGRNHSTVIHAHGAVRAAMADDEPLRRQVEDLWTQLAPDEDAAAGAATIHSLSPSTGHP